LQIFLDINIALPGNGSHSASPLLPFDIRPLRAERQSARMSKITNDCLTRSGTGCFIIDIAVPIWQQWASKG